jgi:hypothetical protein
MAIFEAGHDRCPIFLEPKSALHWLFLKGEKESLDFCHTQGVSKSIPYEFAVDRKLKAGWEKRAPSAEEIQQIKILS